VVANSKAGRQYIISKGVPPEKVRVIHNGIDPGRIRIREKKEEILEKVDLDPGSLIIGVVASLEKHKDPLTFLSAARIVAEAEPRARFMWVGDGPLRDRAARFARDLGIGEKVVFAGNQDNVADYVNTMDVFVLPSAVVEGCSNSILEAMALGVPVVATDVGGNAELIQPGITGDLVKPRKPKEMAQAVLNLTNDSSLRKKVAQNARAAVMSRFSQGAMVKAYETIYRDLCREHA
jgi:glycosyltransferase involved in cell wall biosynthesis